MKEALKKSKQVNELREKTLGARATRSSANGLPRDLGTTNMIAELSTSPTTSMSALMEPGANTDLSTIVDAASHSLSHDTSA